MIGETAHGFKLTNIKEFPGYGATAYVYEHMVHGCPFVHLKSADPNNAFGIGFRTTCENDTGVSHVLEHMVLHGSKKFPITEIFNELYTRSVPTFLNAMTGRDYTLYPFSSMNKKDFMNILDVYTDAAFNPMLTDIHFCSEAHRLEFETPDDPSTPLKHTGVVYNEMAGALSQPSEFYSQSLYENLFPDTVYRYNYGGDPPSIAKLTAEELRAQHAKFYSPSNAIFYHYGSFDADEILAKVDEVISEFAPKPNTIDYAKMTQGKWSEPKAIELEGPIDSLCSDPEKQYVASCSWHISKANDIDSIFDLSMLYQLLMESSATPLYQRILKAGIGSRWTDETMITDVYSTAFNIGIKGASEKNAREFSATVLKALKEIADTGFTPTEIESALHKMEIRDKEISSRQGLSLFFGAMHDWTAGCEFTEAMDKGKFIERLRGRIENNPNYVTDLIHKLLLDNPSRLDFILKPVPGFMEARNSKKLEELAAIKAKLSDAEKMEIVELSKRVKDTLEAPKPIHLLPHITKDDLTAEVEDIPYTIDGNLYMFPQPTNGIFYAELKADVPLDNELAAAIPLLAEVICCLGGNGLDEKEFALQEDLYTGGLVPSIQISGETDDPTHTHGYFVIRGSCLYKNFEHMLRLLKLVTLDPFLDNISQIKTVMEMQASNSIDVLGYNGHRFARKHASSKVNHTCFLEEFWTGITELQRLRSVVQEGDWEKTSSLLKRVYDEVFRKGHFSIAITAEASELDAHKSEFQTFLSTLNSTSAPLGTSYLDQCFAAAQSTPNTFVEFDTAVNFCALAIPSPPLTANAEYSSFAKLVSGDFLWQLIREKLGAYGAMAFSSPTGGSFSMMSYRDANAPKVIEAFNYTLKEIASGNIDDGMVERAIIQCIGGIDSPSSPKGKASNLFISGITQAILADRKRLILATTKDALVSIATKLLSSPHYSTICGNRAVSGIPEGYTVAPLAA